MNYNFSMLTDTKLVMWYYKSKNPNWKCVIVAIWAPNLIDVDNLRNAQILTDAWYDILVPEYYWFCRSKGRFTPKNSIKTLIDTYNIARWKSEKWLKNVYFWKKVKKFSYKEIIFLWMSFGGFAVLMLPKFLPEAKKIIAFYPVLDYLSFWKMWVKEETAKDFYNNIFRWFSTQFRWIKDNIWQKQFQDKLWLSPLYETKYLKNVSVFLAHWVEDESIFYRKTKKYFEILKQKYKSQNIVYKEYIWAWHNTKTMFPATKDAIEWLKN